MDTLLRRRIMMTMLGGSPTPPEPPTPVLPYDAEIEYLESTSGTGQYINTHIMPTSSTGIKMQVSCKDTTDTYIAGLRNATSTNTRWCVGHSSGGFYWGYGSYQTTDRLVAQDATVELNYLGSGMFTASNGTDTKTATLPTLSFTPNKNICLFICNGAYTSSYGRWNGKIYYCKVSQGSDVVMDLIPVRVGQVGYMYDKVTGELFGNSGSGTFILGNDITT